MEETMITELHPNRFHFFKEKYAFLKSDTQLVNSALFFYSQTFGVAAAFTFFMIQFEKVINPENENNS